MDVIPFYTEDWGLPSLGTRWCEVLTVSRDNLKSSVDRAQITTLVVGFIAGGAFAVALCLLSLSVWRVFQDPSTVGKAEACCRLRRGAARSGGGRKPRVPHGADRRARLPGARRARVL